MGSSANVYKDFSLCDRYCGWGAHDISKDLTSQGVSILSHASGKSSAESTGHDKKSHVEVDLKADGG